MKSDLEKIKDKLLDDFITLLKERDAGKFDNIFSYDDVYKIISNLYIKHCKTQIL